MMKMLKLNRLEPKNEIITLCHEYPFNRRRFNYKSEHQRCIES